jgi:hypothetical protein
VPTFKSSLSSELTGDVAAGAGPAVWPVHDAIAARSMAAARMRAGATLPVALGEFSRVEDAMRAS